MRKKSDAVEVINDNFELPEWVKKMTRQEIQDEIIRILLEEGKIKEGEYSIAEKICFLCLLKMS